MAAPTQTMDTGVERANPNPNPAAADIVEPVNESGVAQKPVPERADPQQGESTPTPGWKWEEGDRATRPAALISC